MSEYESGVWYGWNGGDCPVDPRTKVEVAIRYDHTKRISTGDHTYAGDYRWDADRVAVIVAFLIVEVYSPKEFWLTEWQDGTYELHSTEEKANNEMRYGYSPSFIRHLQEIPKDD